MLQVKVREKQITEVLPIPIKINSSFQAALAPVADPLPKLLLAERKPPVLPAP
jgi:hypothetical protein